MKLRAYTKGGVQYWRVDLGMIAGKRVQKQFPTKAKAEAFLSSKRTEMASGGTATVAFSGEDRIAFESFKARLAALGATVDQAIDFFVSARPKHVRSLKEAIDECIQAKRAANRRPRYVDGLESYLTAFAKGREAQAVDAITSADVERWFVSRGETNGTLASNLGRLSALFSLCVRRGYCPVNPCDAIERVHVEHGAPRILSIEDCRRLLDACRDRRPKFMGYLALAMFAGVRPEEIEKLNWSAVDLEQGRVVIDASSSKVRRRRIVDLSPNAVAWLRLCKNRKGRVAPWTTNRRKIIVRQLRNATAEREYHGPKGAKTIREPVAWCQDILRHTAASHWMARDRDAAKVADQLGNSPRVLLTNYRALVGTEDTKEFWGLMP